MRISDWSSDVCSGTAAKIASRKAPIRSHRHPLQPTGRRHRRKKADRDVQATNRGAAFCAQSREAVAASPAAGGSGAAAIEEGVIEMSGTTPRSEEHTSEIQSLMRQSYAV